MRPNTRERFSELSIILLCALLEAGVISLAAFAGSRTYGNRALREVHRFTGPHIRRALSRFRMLGLVRFDPEDETAPIVLTEHGLRRAIQARTRRLFGVRREKRWDHLWRIIMFDIPERWRIRRRFQRELTVLGFYRIQRSVYVHPHDCVPEIKQLIEHFRLDQKVLVTSVADLGPWQHRVRNHFLNH